jgi:hypothetical protein
MNQNKIADALNKHFLSIAESDISDNKEHTSTSITNPVTYLADVFNGPFSKIRWPHATTNEIVKIIKSLQMKNSFGYNEISSRIIKASAPFIIIPLTYIYIYIYIYTHTHNAMLDTGVFPDRLKFTIAKPCFKKGNIQEISNYKAISLLTSFSKTMERLIYMRLITHIKANCI